MIHNIIHWFRQLFCKHDFKLVEEGPKTFTRFNRVTLKTTKHEDGWWQLYLCKKCLFKKDIETS